MRSMGFMMGASAIAMATSANAQATGAPPGGGDVPQETQPAASANNTETETQDIVVTGIRESLRKAAAIKRNSIQVVDSIVSEDIGKFPDPTTAAALQRVPGVQVAVGQNNEIGSVRIRGLGDILTTLDGREIFSTTGRSFSLADVPATALARVDVVKSSTADLIDGGIAGIIDLQLQKPFNFSTPTFVAFARGTYSEKVRKLDGQYSGFATDTWDTGIGQIGALINVSYAKTRYNHPRTREGVRRSAATAPFNLPGVLMPNVSANNGESGYYARPEANGSIQWQPSNNLQIYLDGLYTGYREKSAASLYTSNFFNMLTTVSDVVTNPNECYTARVRTGTGQNPLRVVNTRGTANTSDDILSLQPFALESLCKLESATFKNVVTQQQTAGTVQRTNGYLGALGFKYDVGDAYLSGDLSYQKSTDVNETVTATVGRRVGTWKYAASTGGGATNIVSPDVGSTNGLVLVQGLTQNFVRGQGSLFAARIDSGFKIDSILNEMQFGARFADRSANFQRALINTPAPGGVLGTATENTATLVANTGLPPSFFGLMPTLSRLNDGQRAAVPSADFLNSDTGRDALRKVYGLALGDPGYDPSRRFDASEKTLSFYAQAKYEIPIGQWSLDGVVGIRPTRTQRSIAGASLVTIPAANGQPARSVTQPVFADTVDIDILPNASARLRFGGGLQLRISYSKTVRRPEFSELNPGLTYTLTTNPNLVNSGSAGNPDLRPQKSENFDASLEYYFRQGFLAVAVYKRNIKDRVISSASTEPIDGILYNITRPRNVGAAKLQGVEVSGQTFFDFLPGPLSGFGVFGNFTFADTKIKGNDPLAGLPLLGVSKYNYNAGLLYEKYGLTARAVYNYRSSYYDGDESGSLGLRPVDPARASDPTYIPTLLNYVAASGRLDASLSYDINRNLRIDFGATNILGANYEGYYERRFLANQYRYDDTVYSVGIRAKF